MTERINEYLADQAKLLIRESFTGVQAEWWWERRIRGGIEVCQELDPSRAGREISGEIEVSQEEAVESVLSELGVDEPEPVVLTFEIPGDTTAEEASRMLSERSATPEGLAAPLYARVRADLS